MEAAGVILMLVLAGLLLLGAVSGIALLALACSAGKVDENKLGTLWALFLLGVGIPGAILLYIIFYAAKR